ncbi:unnamed protein product [Rotaria sordida]|uniref:DDE Tnp4 domain-containing protein n=1 Tax=Rotaria sordida TaxID=392033 RepID=A0A818U2C6_9BILA|nr:unnamed protein product [Rotaria sordida]
MNQKLPPNINQQLKFQQIKDLKLLAGGGTIDDNQDLLRNGATSDRSLLNMIGAGSIIELLEPGDRIMSDRGFASDPQHSHLRLIHPPFLQGKSQLSPKKVIETRMIARHRIRVERCMGRIKNYKLLNDIIPMKSIYLLNYWFYICTFFTIFDEPLVKII